MCVVVCVCEHGFLKTSRNVPKEVVLQRKREPQIKTSQHPPICSKTTIVNVPAPQFISQKTTLCTLYKCSCDCLCIIVQHTQCGSDNPRHIPNCRVSHETLHSTVSHSFASDNVLVTSELHGDDERRRWAAQQKVSVYLFVVINLHVYSVADVSIKSLYNCRAR